MISISGKITKKIDNNFRKFKVLSVPQQRNLKEIVKGMLLKKTCYLSEIGRNLSPESKDRKNIERYSNALSKSDQEGMLKTLIKSKKKWFYETESVSNFPKSPNLILVDGGEICKPHSNRELRKEEGQRMEYCCGIADGSEQHKPSWGYKTLNISLHTPHNGRTHILSHHLFSSKAPGYKSDWKEQESRFKQIKSIISPKNSIIIEDSIGDDAQRINFYKNKMQSHFIVRGQQKRKYEAFFNGDKISMNFGEIGKNIMYDKENTRTYFDKKTQRKVGSKVGYLRVEHKDLKDKGGERHRLFLVLVKSESYAIPMAFLTDIEPKTSEEAWQIFFWYKKRWEVEKIYRDIKQKFKLESALIRSYKAWQTLFFLTALAWEAMQELAREVREFLGICYQIFDDWLCKKQKKAVTHLNLLDFLREFLDGYQQEKSPRYFSWKIFRDRFIIHKNQLALIDWRKNG